MAVSGISVTRKKLGSNPEPLTHDQLRESVLYGEIPLGGEDFQASHVRSLILLTIWWVDHVSRKDREALDQSACLGS
jgi:hypothetical protein